MVNCDDSYACVQANTTCRRGDCTVNCLNDFSCLNSVLKCSGENCLLNCDSQESCTGSTVQCLNGNCLVECDWDDTCQRLTLVCVGGDCTVNCSNSRNSCHDLTVECPPHRQCTVDCLSYLACWQSRLNCPERGNCIFNFVDKGYQAGYGSVISCQNNSICTIYCDGPAHYACRSSLIQCPRDTGGCIIQCSGYLSCERSTITLLAKLSCTGQSSCQHSTINCPANNTCTINCDGQYSCNNARVTCPTGDYSCNILCTDPLSCSNLSITNTHNVYLQCCGGLSCAGIGVTPASTECPNIN